MSCLHTRDVLGLPLSTREELLLSPQLPTTLLRVQTDERLVRLAALGSERAFEAIVERYRRPLIGYARRMVGDSRAEDVVQAAFVSAWGRLTDGSDVRDLRAWLFRIVHNGSINVLKRASSRDVELFDDTPALGDLHSEVERREDMRDALDGIASLPLQQREALLGVAVQGRRHRDVGADMGVTDGAVRMLLHRARSNMRTAATALTPWPLLAWLSGERGADAAAGGAGAGMLAGGALKAAAVLSTAAVAVTAAPQIAGHHHAQAPARTGSSAAAVTTLHAALPATGGSDAGSLQRVAEIRRSAARRHALRRVTHHRAVIAPATTPVASLEPSAPASAPASEPAAAAPAQPAHNVEQQNDSTSIPQRPPHKQIVQPAGQSDDDEISVQEEPPDLAAGERPIPPGGVPDAIADAALPEAPAAAADEAELAAEEDQGTPKQEASASASATDQPAPAPADTPAAPAS